MELEDRVLYFITSIRKRLGDNCNYYLNGGCYSFYFKLLGKFTNAVCYYNSEHVITKIGNKYYDITGVVKTKGHLPVDGQFYTHEQLEEEFKKS